MLWLRTMVFPVVHAPFEKWICWPRTNAASQTSTCFQLLCEKKGERGIFKSNLMKACASFPPYLLVVLAIRYWQAFLFHWAGCSGEWHSLIWHVGRHVSIESRNAVHFSFYFQFTHWVLHSICYQLPYNLLKHCTACGLSRRLHSKSLNLQIYGSFLLTLFANCWFSEMHI